MQKTLIDMENQITTFLTFQENDAEEAMNFYTSGQIRCFVAVECSIKFMAHRKRMKTKIRLLQIYFVLLGILTIFVLAIVLLNI